MKICVAQTRPVKGDIEANIANHKKLIDLAITNSADAIIFPELSITGYEPALAKELATTPDDSRFNDFQKLSDSGQITIGIGMPLKFENGICISMLIFQPHLERQVYSKKYLHPDEEPFFVSGENLPLLKIDNTDVALAICYELSIPAHSENAFNGGIEFYLASVAKSAKGVERAYKSLAEIAGKYSMTILMSNCVGVNDGTECVGQSAIWDNTGKLLAQLDDKNEGLLIIDTATQKISKIDGTNSRR